MQQKHFPARTTAELEKRISALLYQL